MTKSQVGMIFWSMDKSFPRKMESEGKVCQAEKRECSKLQIIEHGKLSESREVWYSLENDVGYEAGEVRDSL